MIHLDKRIAPPTVKNLLLGALFLLLGFSVLAQESSVYVLRKPLDVPLLGLSASLWIGSQYYQSQQEALWSEDDLAELDRNDVNPFDRPATYNWNPAANDASDVFLSASFVLPAALLFDKRFRKDWFAIGIMYAEVGFTVGAITEWTKAFVRRPRPMVYNHEAPTEERIDKQSSYSFFSGHTSATAGFLFFTAKVVHDHSSSKWLKRGVWAGAGLYSGVTAWLRMEAGKHYPTDALTGLVVGGAVGILIPQWHKKEDERNAFAPFFYEGATGFTWIHSL